MKMLRLVGSVFVLALVSCGGSATASPASSPAGGSPAAASAKPPTSAPAASSPKPAATAKPAVTAKPAAPASAASKPAAASAGASASAAAVHLDIAYAQATVTQGALFVGADNGMFSKQGLDIALKQVGGSAQTPALLAGEIQIAAMGANEVAHAATGGAPVVMIATAVDYPFFSLYADKKYKSMNDLTGKTIGITAAGTSTDAAAKLFLDHFGLTGKVGISPAGGTQASILAAIENGVVAAGTLAPPVTDQAAKDGLVELVNGIKLGVPMNTTGLSTTRPYIQDHADIVKSFLKGYQEAWTFCGQPANHDAVVKVLAKYTKSQPQAVESGYQEMLKLWQGNKTPAVNPDAVANLLKLDSNPKVRSAQPSDFIDNTLLQAVQ